jgi:hypothetical protein
MVPAIDHRGFWLKSSAGDVQVWEILEPITDNSEETASMLKLFTVTAPSTLSPIEVYMYFAQIRDLAGAKQAQYQKTYGNAETFMRSTNYRFRSNLSIGVLTRMMTNARAARKSKQPDAMGVRIIATDDWKGKQADAGL